MGKTVDVHMLANPLVTSHYLTFFYTHIQSPSISFPQVRSTLLSQYPTAQEKRFKGEMRERSGERACGTRKARMPRHESDAESSVLRQSRVSWAEDRDLPRNMLVCLSSAKKKKKVWCSKTLWLINIAAENVSKAT